ncbi:hypothetical protein OEV98_02105 [Caldibacillus lycopersici]|uniref:Uncharacterized protein n=1 Tax=Perspicuibacillus lycopersici TaxID=1325689 RepID=A0AAE3LPH6_9BACI|nr:hypothetical protein [Perspicuibacillus lycopersici]MCU9612354.1 hypothetical protein [Perspicuibacillus lycopersici]
MAKSNAKKQRLKMAREGMQNPEIKRGTYVFADMRTRKTKTKKEKLNQMKHKKRLSDQYNNGSDKRFFVSFYKYCYIFSC